MEPDIFLRLFYKLAALCTYAMASRLELWGDEEPVDAGSVLQRYATQPAKEHPNVAPKTQRIRDKVWEAWKLL